MFVKCFVKTVEPNPIEFIFSINSFVVIERIRENNQVIVNLNGGTFSLVFENDYFMDRVYRGFEELLRTGDNSYFHDFQLTLLH